jgi:hypothetical protein
MKGDQTMQTRRLTRLSALACAVLLPLLIGSTGADAGTLSGTWRVDVTLTDCQSGMPLPIPHTPVLNTFLTNGSLLSAPTSARRN